MWVALAVHTAQAEESTTALTAEVASVTAQNTWRPWRLSLNSEVRGDHWRGHHTQLATAVGTAHETAGGWRFGLHVGRIAGEPEGNGDQDPLRTIRRPGDTEPLPIPDHIDRAYALWAVSGQLGRRWDRVAMDGAATVILGPDGTQRLVPGLRARWGELALDDGPRQWVELTLGNVDSFPAVGQFALGVGFEFRWLQLRLGLEANNILVYDPTSCDRPTQQGNTSCALVDEADGGGLYADMLLHLGPVDVHLRGVARETPWGLVGVGSTF